MNQFLKRHGHCGFVIVGRMNIARSCTLIVGASRIWLRSAQSATLAEGENGKRKGGIEPRKEKGRETPGRPVWDRVAVSRTHSTSSGCGCTSRDRRSDLWRVCRHRP